MFCNSLRQAPKFMTLSLGEDVTDIIPFISKSSLKTISKTFSKKLIPFLRDQFHLQKLHYIHYVFDANTPSHQD